MTEIQIERCPACDHLAFDVDARTCNHCGVAVARGVETPHAWRGGHRYPRRPDQDRVGSMTDYARTKQDKEL